MKMKPMLKYTTSCLYFLLVTTFVFSQSETIDATPKTATDNIVFQDKYGLRFGADLSKLGRTAFETDYSGFEINADYRLGKRLYIAGELGFEEKTTKTDYLDASAKGNYFKAGIDYNLYNNWLGMENLIVSGLRFGVSQFSQTRERYTVYDTNSQTWSQIQNNESMEFSGLTAAWVELIFGIKAELFNNLFLGFNVQLKARISEKSPDNFENLYIPGFGRTYDSSKVGTGFSYNISYLLPIYKKARVQKQETKADEEALDE
ncbi:MAG: Uncharacterised protein [Formosa sp. Hel3_A1_48]|nr:MAG: Uncharacterised protein [Formosa sp. Hel3_A1_48]